MASNKFSVEIKRYLPYIDEGEHCGKWNQQERNTFNEKISCLVWNYAKNDKLELEITKLRTITTINNTPVNLGKNHSEVDKFVNIGGSIIHRGDRGNRSDNTLSLYMQGLEKEGNESKSPPPIKELIVKFKQIRPAEKCDYCTAGHEHVEYAIYYPSGLLDRRCKVHFEEAKKNSEAKWILEGKKHAC